MKQFMFSFTIVVLIMSIVMTINALVICSPYSIVGIICICLNVISTLIYINVRKGDKKKWQNIYQKE